MSGSEKKPPKEAGSPRPSTSPKPLNPGGGPAERSKRTSLFSFGVVRRDEVSPEAREKDKRREADPADSQQILGISDLIQRRARHLLDSEANENPAFFVQEIAKAAGVYEMLFGLEQISKKRSQAGRIINIKPFFTRLKEVYGNERVEILAMIVLLKLAGLKDITLWKQQMEEDLDDSEEKKESGAETEKFDGVFAKLRAFSDHPHALQLQGRLTQWMNNPAYFFRHEERKWKPVKLLNPQDFTLLPSQKAKSIKLTCKTLNENPTETKDFNLVEIFSYS